MRARLYGLCRWRMAWLLAALLASGCATSVPVAERFPTPLVEPVPATVGVYYSEPFRTYTHETANRWNVSLGAANVALFERLFAGMFRRVVPAKAPQAASGNAADLDAILEPRVNSYELTTPAASGSKFYQVRVEYRMRLYEPDGALIADWPVNGYGKARSKLLRGRGSAGRATAIALRDAAASLAIHFSEEPDVRDWLMRVKTAGGTTHDPTTRRPPPG